MARQDGPDQERMAKNRDGSSKALLMAAAALSAIDTARKVPFAGKKGIDKIKEMDSSDLHSIVENQIEGTDIAENFGMTPGALSTYIVGQILDVADPLTMGATALKVPGIVARLAKPAGKKLTLSGIKDVLKKSVDAELLGDVPVLAKEAQDSKLYKKFGNPKKAVEQLKGSKALKNIGTDKAPIMSMEKVSKGSLDESGEKIAEIIRQAQIRGADKVSVPDIKQEIMSRAVAKNADPKSAGVQDMSSLERALDDILKPTKTVEVPPKIPQEALDTPPPIPKEARAKGIHAGTKKPEWYDDDMGLPHIVKKGKPEENLEEVPDVLDIDALWQKRQSIDDKIKYNKKMPITDQLSEQQRILRESRNETDLAIQKAMRKVRLEDGFADDVYKGAKSDYKTKSQLAKVMEKAEAADARKTGSGLTQDAVEEGGRVAASGGASATYAAGRFGGNVANRAASKAKILTGDALQDDYLSTLGVEAMTEVPEIPFDPKYVEETDTEGDPATSPEDEIGDMPEGYTLAPKTTSVEGPVQETQAPIEPQRDPSSEPIHQKMDDVLTPPKAVWDPYINEEVLNTFLPRDSKRVMANPKALMAKIHQVAPAQVNVVQEMLDNDPEGMAEAGPKIAMMFPTIFEKDKYGAFDGKIIDPKMKQKFLLDLSQDEEMNAIEKANMAMNLHRGESVWHK